MPKTTKVFFLSQVQMVPRSCAIAFDRETWDFYVYVDGEMFAMLDADQGSALRDEILKTAKATTS